MPSLSSVTLPRYFTVWDPKRLRPLASFFNRLLAGAMHSEAAESCVRVDYEREPG
jgi:hypothetical protein